MRKFGKCLAAIAAIWFSDLHGNADSYYLTNSRPITTSQRFINNVSASDKIVAWQESRSRTNILKAQILDKGTISNISTSAISLIDMHVKNSNVYWIDSGKSGYFTWNEGAGIKNHESESGNLRRLIALDNGVAYENAGKITVVRDGRDRTIYFGKLLAGEKESLILDNSINRGAASVLKKPIPSGETNTLYVSQVPDSYISGNGYSHDQSSTWMVGEKLLAQNAYDFFIYYHDGKSLFPVAKSTTALVDLSLTEKDLFWNQWNSAKRKNELYNWSPTKGSSFLSDKVTIPAYKFAVTGNKVYISNTNTLYQADLVEYPALAPEFTMHGGLDGQQSLEFRVKNPVQGKEYTLQTSIGLPGNWGDLSRVQTSFQITKDNSPSAVQFIYNPHQIRPQQFFRIRVDKP